MISKIVQIKALPKMERLAESGLEVQLSTSPEVAAQSYQNKYYIGDDGSHYVDQNGPVLSSHPVIGERGQSGQSPRAKNRGRARSIGGLAILAVVCLAVALGAGIGVGLAAQHKPSPLG